MHNTSKYKGQELSYKQAAETKAGYIQFFEGLNEPKIIIGSREINIPFIDRYEDLSIVLLASRNTDFHSRMYMVLMRIVLYYMLKKCGFKQVVKHATQENTTTKMPNQLVKVAARGNTVRRLAQLQQPPVKIAV